MGGQGYDIKIKYDKKIPRCTQKIIRYNCTHNVVVIV